MNNEDFESAWEFFCEKVGIIAPRHGDLYLQFAYVWSAAVAKS